MKLDQSEVQERIELLQASAAMQGIKLPDRTGDLLEDLQRLEAAVPNPSQQMKTLSTSTTNTNSQPTGNIAASLERYHAMSPAEKARFLQANERELRQLVIESEHAARMNPAN